VVNALATYSPTVPAATAAGTLPGAHNLGQDGRLGIEVAVARDGALAKGNMR